MNKWVKGHKCGLKQLLMMDFIDVAPPEDCVVKDANPELQVMDLSSCAFYGTTTVPHLRTMKVKGTIGGHAVTILLDSCSTHNFIDSKLLKHWGLQVHATTPFEVMIADE